jgi:hypothetical protein
VPLHDPDPPIAPQRMANTESDQREARELTEVLPRIGIDSLR